MADCCRNLYRNKFFFSISRIDVEPVYDGTDKSFDYSAYNSVNSKNPTLDALTAYKNAGMTILLPQDAVSVSAGSSSGTHRQEIADIKSLIDKALEVGINKVVVTDYRLIMLCRETSEGGVIGTGNFTNSDILSYQTTKFATETALDNYVYSCLREYATHTACYGVFLQDEPKYDVAEAYGQVYQSIKRVSKKLSREIYVQMNLFPMESTAYKFYSSNQNQISGIDDLVTRYKSYVNLFLDATGCDYLQYDQYPVTANKGIIGEYIRGFQVAAEICRERGIELKHIAQTTGYNNNGNPNRRVITEADARWINNVMLGFGVKDILYYTYCQKDSVSDEQVIDGSNFLNTDGTTTELYSFMQKIIKENNDFANVILNFNYNSSKLFSGSACSCPQTNYMTSGTLQKVTGVTVDKAHALVTELYDAEQDRYIYMLQNIENPIEKGTETQTSTIIFSPEFAYAAVFVNGVRTDYDLNNGSLTLTQTAGNAAFIMPY